jgi:hypothetical protein
MDKQVKKRFKELNRIQDLTAEQKQNPEMVFVEFFSNFHLNDIKEELWEWLWCALANETCYYQTGLERSNLIFFYEHMERLTEAAYILFKKNGWYEYKETIEPQK